MLREEHIGFGKARILLYIIAAEMHEVSVTRYVMQIASSWSLVGDSVSGSYAIDLGPHA